MVKCRPFFCKLYIVSCDKIRYTIARKQNIPQSWTRQEGKTDPMKRRDFCKALALSAAALAVPRAAAENTQGAVGRAVADGRYSMRFRSELSLTDVPHDYYYSDSFFVHSALEYDHSLALASLGLVGAAFNTAASDARYWANGEVGREANLCRRLCDAGLCRPRVLPLRHRRGAGRGLCGPQPGPEDHPLNGQRATIVAVILRGGGYGGEWVSNLHTGVGGGPRGLRHPGERGDDRPPKLSGQGGRPAGRDGHRQALGGRLQPGRGRRQPAGGADQQRTARDRPQKRLRLHVRHAGGPDRRQLPGLSAGLRQQSQRRRYPENHLGRQQHL